MKERSITADVLKGLAVLFMIQVHIMEVFADPSIYGSMTGRISLFLGGPPAAPVFMTVMGYFLSRTNKDFKTMLLRGVKLLMGGITLNIALNSNLLYKIATGQSNVNPLDFIFGIDILVLAGVTTIVMALLKKLLDVNFVIPLILALVIFYLTPLINSTINNTSGSIRYFVSVLGGDSSWSYFPIFPWAAYPLLGYGVSLFMKSEMAGIFEKKQIIFPLLVVWAVWVVYTIEFGITTAATLKNYYHHGLEYGLWAAGFTGGFALLIDQLVHYSKENEFFNYFALIGRNVTVAYVIQWVIIGNIGSAVYRSVGLRDSYVALVAVVLFTSAVVYFKETGLHLKIWKYRTDKVY